jgi:hypothetical protein
MPAHCLQGHEAPRKHRAPDAPALPPHLHPFPASYPYTSPAPQPLRRWRCCCTTRAAPARWARRPPRCGALAWRRGRRRRRWAACLCHRSGCTSRDLAQKLECHSPPAMYGSVQAARRQRQPAPARAPCRAPHKGVPTPPESRRPPGPAAFKPSPAPRVNGVNLVKPSIPSITPFSPSSPSPPKHDRPDRAPTLLCQAYQTPKRSAIRRDGLMGCGTACRGGRGRIAPRPAVVGARAGRAGPNCTRNGKGVAFVPNYCA